MTTHQARVELLERAIGYTRGTLAGVNGDVICRRTPCAGWRLQDLLDHMADSLETFFEASRGAIEVSCPPRQGSSVEVLKERACTLLGAWSHPVRPVVTVGELALDRSVVLEAAALEIAVHGWDVGQATGAAPPLPEDLADALFPTAVRLVSSADRGVRFAPPVVWPGRHGAGPRLLGFCGRAPLLPQPSQPQQG